MQCSLKPPPPHAGHVLPLAANTSAPLLFPFLPCHLLPSSGTVRDRRVASHRQGWAGGMSEPATQCRGNVGGGSMRTVECLRGRLLAERVASKAAKEEADQLATRLDELEKKLADEVKIRNKAERRLRNAIKRLESLKNVEVGLSESSTGSLSSNSNGCSAQHAPKMEERNEYPAGSLASTVDSVWSGPHAAGEGDGDSAKGSSAGSCTLANSSQDDGSWFSVVSEQSGSGLCCKEESRMDPDGTKNCDGSGDSAAGDVGHDSQREPEQPAASSGSSKSEASYRDEQDDRLALVLVDNPHYTEDAGRPRTEDDLLRTSETNDSEDREAGSNSLAIVLILTEPQPQRDAPAMSGGNQDVRSVLLALRQVKEQLRYTIERRSEGGLVTHRELYGH